MSSEQTTSSFNELGLNDAILRAVTECGYTTPTPVQQQAIPVVLAGHDLLAGAQTGTGKTAGFTLPLLHKLSANKPAGKPAIRALILTPTRELAAQVEDNLNTYAKYTGLKSLVIFGGVGINPQIDKLRRGVDILVATPGRLLDHCRQGTLDLSKVEVLVLDEADRMLDMGFIHDIKKVLKLVPAKRQTLLFSATFSDEIKALSKQFLTEPKHIEVARRNATADRIEQRVFPVDKKRKRELLSYLIGSRNWRQVLVFTRTKHGANRLATQLTDDGLPALAIHGNKSQAARTKALAQFKAGKLRVLVATDIAARGIDIDELPHVVNYELPQVAEDYVHRIGRTGRAGSEGEAISLVCIDEHKLLRDIERVTKNKIPEELVPGYEVDPSIKAEPLQNGRGQRSQGGGQGRNQSGRGGNAGRAGGGQGRDSQNSRSGAGSGRRNSR
ncbi:MAG: DEAD/DEAH box helicase [Idiomarina sp.]